MKTIFKILLLGLSLLGSSFAYAGEVAKEPVKHDDKKIEKVAIADKQDKPTEKPAIADKIDDKQEDSKGDIIKPIDIEPENNTETGTKSLLKGDKPEQKSDATEEAKVERAKITKSLNNLIIESYKKKFTKILGNLSYNIRDKTKEEKLKILSTVIVSTKIKLDQIDSDQLNISGNKKEILVGILKHIKSELEDELKVVAKEK
jgi:hypothetical protein